MSIPSARARRHDEDGATGDVAAVMDGLGREIEDLGLSPYEARVLLALLQLGSASSVQLARTSGVPRTSTYQVLDELMVKNLAERLPGTGTAVWTSPGHDAVLDRLQEAEERRLREHRDRAGRVRTLLAKTLPEHPSSPMPYVHVIAGTADVKRFYEQMLADVESELLMFTRPPYTWAAGSPNQAVLDMLARGVSARVLYQASHLELAGTEAFRREIEVYHEAGVEGRVTDALPIKLVVIDRKQALLAMPDPGLPGAGFPTTLCVEHPGFASVQADGFERCWEQSRPYEALAATRGKTSDG